MEVDVIVPTFREVENVKLLVGRLKQVRNESGLSLYVTIVDDNSQDGIDTAISEAEEDWVRLIVRTMKNPGKICVEFNKGSGRSLGTYQGGRLACLRKD